MKYSDRPRAHRRSAMTSATNNTSSTIESAPVVGSIDTCRCCTAGVVAWHHLWRALSSRQSLSRPTSSLAAYSLSLLNFSSAPCSSNYSSIYLDHICSRGRMRRERERRVRHCHVINHPTTTNMKAFVGLFEHKDPHGEQLSIRQRTNFACKAAL